MSTTLSPYLNFDGQAKEAMEFYRSVLGGELKINTFGESNPETPVEQKDRTMHADLKNNLIQLYASDIMPGMQLTAGNAVHLSLVGGEHDGLAEIFANLAEGGQLEVPLEKAAWGDTFGMLTDKFGMHWMVNISAN
jgi:PhnB protein